MSKKPPKNTPKKIKKSKKIYLITPPKKSLNQQDFIDDSISLLEEGEYGDIVGYAVVAIYKDRGAIGCQYKIPDSFPEHLFPLYVAEVVKDFMDENDDYE